MSHPPPASAYPGAIAPDFVGRSLSPALGFGQRLDAPQAVRDLALQDGQSALVEALGRGGVLRRRQGTARLGDGAAEALESGAEGLHMTAKAGLGLGRQGAYLGGCLGAGATLEIGDELQGFALGRRRGGDARRHRPVEGGERRLKLGQPGGVTGRDGPGDGFR